MKSKTEIQNEIKKTLNSLNQVKKIEADAFFYTRLKAKLDKESTNSKFDWYFESIWFKSVAAAIILFFNIITITHFLNNETDNLANSNAADLFSQEYYLSQSTDTFYDLNETE